MLMKVKLNSTEEQLTFLFNISVSTVSKIFSTWITFLSHELSQFIKWPTLEEIKVHYPACFTKWDKIVAIIDCFEIKTERPSHIEANSLVFSTYKNSPTVKFLIACTPGGLVSFISQPAGGNMSDKQIVIESKLPEKFLPGEQCMADKGFTIQGELLEKGVELIIPPFARKGQGFSDENSKLNRDVAHARIHIERVINRVRDYRILSSGPVPISTFDLIGPIVNVCCALTNLKPSIIPYS